MGKEHVKSKVVNTINTGVNPAGMAITSKGTYAYVANNNNYNIAGQDSVTVINLKKGLPIKTIYDASFNEPYTVTIHKDKVYVTNSGASTISVIDMNTDIVIDVIDGFDGPSGMVIKNNIGYVNNYGATPGVGSGNGKTVRLVDLTTHNIIGEPIEVGLAPAAIAITPNKKYVYTANYVDGNPNTSTLTKIRTRDNTVVGTISGELSGIFAIVVTDKKAYVTNFGSNNFEPFGTTMSIINLSTNTIENNIVLGIQPSGIDIVGNHAVVTNYNTLYAYVQPDPLEYLNLTAGRGTVNVVDLETKKVIETIPVDQSPSCIVVTPDKKYACVTNYTSNTVNIIRLAL